MEAPRWKLQEPHYLNVPGTEWDHKEMNMTTRKQITKHVKVPMYLDPKEAADWNYPEEIIVAHEVEGAHNQPRDIIFEGPPTMSMEPLNAEARKLSAEVAAKSQHPIESLSGTMSEDILAKFTRQLEAVVQKAGGYPQGASPISNTPAPGDQLAAMQAQLNAALERVAELERKTAQGDMAEAEPLPVIEDIPSETAQVAKPELSLAQHAQRAAAQVQGRRL